MKTEYQDHLCQEALAQHRGGRTTAIYSQVEQWRRANLAPWMTVWMARMWAASPFSLIVRGVTAEPFSDDVLFASAVDVGESGIIRFRPAAQFEPGVMLARITMRANGSRITEPGAPIWLVLAATDARWWPVDAVVDGGSRA